MKNWLDVQRVVVNGYASGWRLVMNGVPQRSILGQMLFNINDLDSGIECTLSKFSDDNKLSDAVDSLEERDDIQKDQGSLEKWANIGS